MQFLPARYDPPGPHQESYLLRLDAYNKETHRRLRDAFACVFETRPVDATIAVIGSDGRFEKSPASPIELCIYHAGDETAHIISGINNVIRKSSKELFLQEIDVKDTTQNGINYYRGDSARAFPTRVTDSTAVYGAINHLNSAKQKLVDEWAGKEGRHILDRVSSKTREARKIIDKNGEGTYKGTLVRHFDFETGIATYDPSKFHLSFKAGPLRTVQYAISRALIKHARKGTMEAAQARNIVRSMPTNTAERLGFLADTGCFSISLSDAATLGEHYNYFNTLYHVSENAFLCGNTETQIADKSEAKKRAGELVTLVDKLD